MSSEVLIEQTVEQSAIPHAAGTTEAHIDALLPKDMATKAEDVGVRKANMDAATMFALAVLAGAFIALGAVVATIVSVSGAADPLPYGVTKLLCGLVFSLGLILVIVGGAELFTGNNLIVMAWASRRITTRALLRNWGIVYLGNLVGSLAIALLVFGSGQYMFANGEVGKTMLSIANAKCELGFFQATCLGVLCNILVCLAVWLTLSARTTTDRIMAIIAPITAFVAAGFEHSVANMYFIPVGLLTKYGATPEFWNTVEQTGGNYSGLTVSAMFANLVPVTLGNIIGGAILVGTVYWFVYLRDR
ncbi:MAG: formate transporter FocA [Planctomycetaceae bacterium]